MVGRPREFDEGEAIARVTCAFWENGYAGTSLDDLVAATGLNRSSLYNAFGDKRALFRAALDHYRAGPARQIVRPLVEERGARALRGFLRRLSGFIGSSDGSRGCLMVNTLAGEELDATAAARVQAHFAAIHAGIERAYRDAVRDGELQPRASPGVVADWLLVVVRGVLLGAGSGEDLGGLQRALRLTGGQLGLH